MSRLTMFTVLLLVAASLGCGKGVTDPGGTDAWVQISGPGDTVRTFAVNGTSLYAGTNGLGVFRSTDNGANWTRLPNGMPPIISISALAVNGTSLFAAGGNGDGVFRSTDDGANWIAAGLTGTHVRALAVSGTSLFAATGGGVFRSTDDGGSWTAVNNGLPPTTFSCLAVSGTSLFAGSIDNDINQGKGVFRSTDNGESWTAVHNGMTEIVNVYALGTSGTSLFAGTVVVDTIAGGHLAWGGRVYRSIDDGVTWMKAENGMEYAGATGFAVSGTSLFAGTVAGLYRSTDNGANWTGLRNGIPNTAFVSVAALAVSGTYLFASMGLEDFRGEDHYYGLWRRPL